MWKEARAVSEELLIAQCSPTMAGLKTGSLFACPTGDRREVTASLRRLNARLVPRGVRLLPVKRTPERTLFYMYRPKKLRADLQNATAAALLAERHYPLGDADRCVVELIRRLEKAEDFPHEIGLFLGYPPEDVRGFITLGAARAKCVGTWRVYGDEEAAKKTFALYHKCTRLYSEAYRRNSSFDRLVVSCS